MEYIQQQLSRFSVGMSTKMSRIGIFPNMEGTENVDDLRAATIYQGRRRAFGGDAALQGEVGPGIHVNIKGGPSTKKPHFTGEVWPR